MRTWKTLEPRTQSGRNWAVYVPADESAGAEAIVDTKIFQTSPPDSVYSLIEELWREATSRAAPRNESSAEGPVTGRGAVTRFRTPDGPSVVIRRALHGGFLRSFLGGTYFRMSGRVSRVFDELFVTAHLDAQGVLVPKPVAALVSCPKVKYFYSAVIATEEIPFAKNLLDLCLSGKSEAEISLFAERAGFQAGEMLKAGVFHPDLHLANIVASGEAAYLIDFDKASFITVKSSQEFMNFSSQLLSRFRRFAEKYQVGSVVLSKAFFDGLVRSGRALEKA